MVRRTSQVVDDDPKILLPREYLNSTHPPILQRGMPVMFYRQALGLE